MIRRALAATLAAPLLALAAGCASADHYVAPMFPEPAAADAARSEAAFKSMAALAGNWEGEMGEGEGKHRSTVDYRVTSGGSAVEEVLARGTKYEMVTMYHLDGGRLLLTHYCAAGNQPTMVLQPGDDAGDLRFEFLRGTNMQAADGHMHQARYELLGADKVRASWTYWEGGKAGDTMVLEFHRTK